MAVILMAGAEAQAQVRRVVPGARPAAPAAGQSAVAIRKVEILGMKTPEFRMVETLEPPAKAQDWALISVSYETEEDWIDELEFQYRVLVENPKPVGQENPFSMLPGSVTYVDVAKGKRHTSTVFLRPNTVARYGSVKWAGVRILLKGQPVATAQIPNDERPWTAPYRTLDGMLLNRAQTPFALVSPDNYETIKQR